MCGKLLERPCGIVTPGWPLPMLAIGRVLAALAIQYLPGRGGLSPADGFKLHGSPAAI
jgi:hypothetical protein